MGKLKWVDQDVELSSYRKELFENDRSDEPGVKMFGIGLPGYTRINAVTNLMIITPPKLFLADEKCQNPHFIRDERQMILQVITRKIAFGYDRTGHLVAIDQTVSFDPQTRLKDRLMKLKDKYPEVVQLVNWDSVPVGKKKTGFFLATVETPQSTIGLFVERIDHAELATTWERYNNDRAVSERISQTICERNALRKHPAIGLSEVPVTLKGSDEFVANLKFRHFQITPEMQEQMQSIASKLRHDQSVDIQLIQSKEDGGE